MTTTQRRSSMRERFREQVREDVRAVALRQLAEGGAQAISLNAIAKEIGVSGPALYRYYANRDELLNTLVVDAYDDLRDHLAADAREHPVDASPAQRLRRLAHAYRGWAAVHPHRYELLYRPPFPGYDAHAAPIAAAAGGLMDVVQATLLGTEVVTKPQPRDWNEPIEDFSLRLWTRLHGFVSLETGGAYTATAVAADALFDAEVAALATALESVGA